MRRILEHPEAVPGGDRHDRVHVGRRAGVVYRDDADRAGRDRGLELPFVDLECFTMNVDVHRRRASDLDHVHRRSPRHRRRDHLVTRLQAQRNQTDVLACGGRRERQGVRKARVGRKVLLELLRLRTGRDPPRLQGVHDLIDLHLTNRRAGEGEEVGALAECRGHRDAASVPAGGRAGAAVPAVPAPPFVPLPAARNRVATSQIIARGRGGWSRERRAVQRIDTGGLREVDDKASRVGLAQHSNSWGN